MGEGAAHKDHSRAGKVARRGRVARMTATAAANGYQQRPATTHNARTIRANLAYARPEKTSQGLRCQAAISSSLVGSTRGATAVWPGIATALRRSPMRRLP